MTELKGAGEVKVEWHSSTRDVRPRHGPLAGIRVADFCWHGVGSIATRLLGDFGAEVIKIENRLHIDTPRKLPIYKGEPKTFGEEEVNPDLERSGLFNNYCRNKLGITINMGTERGRRLAEQLISVSSVVTENFSPGVMERWGLTYGRLKELSPNVIYARMSGYGHTGPHAGFRSYGPIVQAVSGLSYVCGLPGKEPSGWGLSYMDIQGAYYNSAALLIAIYQRNLTGRGTEIDMSAIEVGINLLGPLLLDVSINKHSTRRCDFPPGNRLEWPDAAPHGVYPALGADRWVAIGVFSDEEWRRFRQAIGDPEWTDDRRFATQHDRVENQDALDEYISEWTREHDRYAITDLLQSHGVPAGAVQNAQDLSERDPQTDERELFFELDHPVIGRAKFEGIPIRFSDIRPDHWRSAPLLGEDNEYVFKQILGVTDEEYQTLVGDHVI